MRRLPTLLVVFQLLLSLTWAATDAAEISITITNNDVDWCNLQYPDTGSFISGDEFLVYARVYEPGITDAAGQGSGISAWIGYSTSNSDPSGTDWTWATASYNTDQGNNDEYMLDLGGEITVADSYYVASRFSLDGTNFRYGGYSAGGGGFWDGTSNVSGLYEVSVNLAPVLTAIGDQVLTEDTAAALALAASDADGDSLSFSVSGGSSSTISALVRNDSLILTPAADYYSNTGVSLTVEVTDTRGASDSETITVTVTNVNDAPVLTAIADQTGSEGQELRFDLSATDVDGDVLSWSASNLPAGATLTDNGDNTASFVWTPGYTQSGVYSGVTFTVDDGQGGQVSLRLRRAE